MKYGVGSMTILFSVHLAPLEEENRVMLIVFVIYTDLRFPGLRGGDFSLRRGSLLSGRTWGLEVWREG